MVARLLIALGLAAAEPAEALALTAPDFILALAGLFSEWPEMTNGMPMRGLERPPVRRRRGRNLA